MQADAQLAIGKPEAALASVAAGLKAVEKTGGAPLEAELYRLRGEALLAGAGTASEAETAMQQAIAVARRQNAKSWELRAATSLAVTRRRFSSGCKAHPATSLQPEATGAGMEETKCLKPSDSGSRIGDRASVQAATRVNAEQSSHDAVQVKGQHQGSIDKPPVASASQV